MQGRLRHVDQNGDQALARPLIQPPVQLFRPVGLGGVE
jgi:hypothetical protein